MALTFYWHDYETWGADPRKDRAAQFAGIRTDLDFNIIGRPLSLYCRPSDDILPQPEACLVTGITPQRALAEGVIEAEFFDVIHQELSHPGTCGVGYNSIRFDDEFTRYGLYRNFFDPYAREWQNGNSRWDIIDMVRLTRALRPEGIEWPVHEDGSTSFRLEKLTEANGIAHEAAHDALSDVYATIAMAKLVKTRQPRLFDHIFQLRDKHKLAGLLDPQKMQPMLHVSSMFPASLGCISMVVPIARHPSNANGIIVYDLRQDPADLIEVVLYEIHRRLFTPRDELPQGMERVPLKTVHVNKAPVIVPLNTLTDEMAGKCQLDIAQGWDYLRRLQNAAGLVEKVQAVHGLREFSETVDPDQNLYGGGFFSDADRRQMTAIRTTEPGKLADAAWFFEDPRLPEMLFRYRARNWPETLSGEERLRWDEFRRDRLSGGVDGASITLQEYRQSLARLMIDPALDEDARTVLSALADWPDNIGL